MKTTLIRYRTHAERADDNEALIKAVFAQLEAQRLPGVHYATLRLADATFYHLVAVESEPSRGGLVELPAFKAFQAGIRDRCAEAPVSSEVQLVGNYRMLGS